MSKTYLATKTAVDTAQSTADAANSTATAAKDAVDLKIDKSNPTGTGTFSVSRTGNVGTNSFAFQGEASGDRSIAIGEGAVAENGRSIAIGRNVKGDYENVIIGVDSISTGLDIICIGGRNNAQQAKKSCTILGNNNVVTNLQTMAIGYNLNVDHQKEVSIGYYNDASPFGILKVANGTSDGNRSNCLRVTDIGVYGKGSYNASGADYAEMFEWADGNPSNEDRVGRFVTLHEKYISLAESKDDFILGIVSALPSVCGDTASEDWQGRFEKDIFGRFLFEDVEIPEEINNETNEIISEVYTINWYKQNPNWKGEQNYVARENRPEWSPIGLLGKLVMIDDGTSEIDGYVEPTIGGIATKSDTITKFRVMERLDSFHIRILIL